MKIEGTLLKQDEFFAVEIPMLAIFTQGTSLEDALDMAKDAVETVVDQGGFEASVELINDNVFIVSSNNERALLATCLKQLRATHGLSIRDVARALGSSSPTAYSVYESGEVMPSFEKFNEIIRVLSGEEPIITFAERKRA